jgi:hypothetical protein
MSESLSILNNIGDPFIIFTHSQHSGDVDFLLHCMACVVQLLLFPQCAVCVLAAFMPSFSIK